MYKKILIIIILLIVSFKITNSQQLPPCKPNYQGLSFSSPLLQSFCPLTSDMPYDVMVGYLVLDSISNCYLNYYTQIIANQQSLTDSVLTIFKYLYELDDYDPILFYNNIRVWNLYGNHIQKTPPYLMYEFLFTTLWRISDHQTLDNALLGSHYIFHIKVNEVLAAPIQNNGRNWNYVNCQILDTIKGKVSPVCSPFEPTLIKNCKFDLKSKSDNIQNNNSCFQFQYCPQWTRGYTSDVGTSNDITLIDSLGNSWIKPGEKYIVFLINSYLCADTSGYYFCIYPYGLHTMTYSMFPIKSDGTVYDPGNDFGFGTPMNVNDFKAALRQRINFIINR